ncbi:hypothetical protein ACKKBG_A16960 [Auxenochlorella protothecoides x Auxenochlorella symbiontica]|uniref:Uncharacterized protein n=1 Tax=Auxenochlorella protothecoides TaxID=3075 RepID=A0A1D2A5T0_AUXPR
MASTSGARLRSRLSLKKSRPDVCPPFLHPREAGAVLADQASSAPLHMPTTAAATQYMPNPAPPPSFPTVTGVLTDVMDLNDPPCFDLLGDESDGWHDSPLEKPAVDDRPPAEARRAAAQPRAVLPSLPRKHFQPRAFSRPRVTALQPITNTQPEAGRPYKPPTALAAAKVRNALAGTLSTPLGCDSREHHGTPIHSSPYFDDGAHPQGWSPQETLCERGDSGHAWRQGPGESRLGHRSGSSPTAACPSPQDPFWSCAGDGPGAEAAAGPQLAWEAEDEELGHPCHGQAVVASSPDRAHAPPPPPLSCGQFEAADWLPGSCRPWWQRFLDFVPVEALRGGTDPRDGSTVHINYRAQFVAKAAMASTPAGSGQRSGGKKAHMSTVERWSGAPTGGVRKKSARGGRGRKRGFGGRRGSGRGKGPRGRAS